MNNMVLLLDIGNSRIKWALVQAGEWLAEGVSTHDKLSDLLHEWDRFPTPVKVVGCNVAGEKTASLISQYWQRRNVSTGWIKSNKTLAGVHNLYDKPEQLGTDRWAALIGAWKRAQGPCLVVSAGTAVTVDALNEKGEFIGGFILPGKRLMHESLVTGTHALNDLDGEIVDFPRNTADATTTGIAIALASSIQAAYQSLGDARTPAPLCVITGGDAEWLANQLQIGVIIAPKLVLEGLLIMAGGVDQS